MFMRIMILAWFVVILCLTEITARDLDDLEPGQCLSKFDYDYKVMQKLVQFEKEILELKQRKTCTMNGISANGKPYSTAVQKVQSSKDINGADTKQVAFMAELSADLVDPLAGTTVVFDSVRTNVGDGYKPGPGIFVAPVNGTYSINLVASSGKKASSSNLHLYIMHNKIKVGYVYLDDNSDRYLLRSTTAVLELKTDDTVFVKIGSRRGAGTVEGGGLHTHFSGFLIN